MNTSLPRKRKTMRYLSWEYWTNNTALILAILGLGLMILILATWRIVHFRHMTMLSGFPDLFTLIARASGKNLVALSVIVILLVLRNSITFLRAWGLGRYLPLDNNIYFHKLVGRIIFAQAWLHTIMHLINFGQHVFIEIYQHSFDQFRSCQNSKVNTR